MSFQQLGVTPELAKTLQEEGYYQPTDIQQAVIPYAFQGKDVLAQAETGSGKSLAFLIPIIQTIDRSSISIQALVLTPTRELAIQLTAEARKLANQQPDRVLSIYGGKNIMEEITALEQGPSLIIATPGRLLDHLRRGTLVLNQLSNLVLDEMDRMLDLGFIEEVQTIMDTLPTTRQTYLFSATLNDRILKLSRKTLKEDAEVIRLGIKENVASDHVKQIVIETGRIAKQTVLIQTLNRFHPYLSVVFCRTQGRVNYLNQALSEAGFRTAPLHGGLSQTKREEAMNAFRDHAVDFLIATDVAARGVDIPAISHVFNFDIPQNATDYIHRIGRTGRGGGQGLAVTFVTPRDRRAFAAIEKALGVKLKRTQL